MIDVDPFVIPLPDQFRRDPNTLAYMQYLERFLHSLWMRTGGGDDAIAELEIINTYETTSINGRLADAVDNDRNQEIALILSRLHGRVASLENDNSHLKTQVLNANNVQAAVLDRVANVERILSKQASDVAAMQERLSMLDRALTLQKSENAALKNNIADLERHIAFFNSLPAKVSALSNRIDYVELK